MAITIKTNAPQLEPQKKLQRSTSAESTSLERLSSGVRAPDVKGDAAALTVSESMSTKMRSLTVAEGNAQDAVSMLQTREGALAEMQSIMVRMRELATRGAGSSSGATDRGSLGTEYEALKSEIGLVLESAKFNGRELLSLDAGVQLQVGEGDVASDPLMITFGGLDLAAITGSGNSIGGSGVENAQEALTTIDSALRAVSTERAKDGSAMERLDSAIASIATKRLNLTAPDTRIRDVDVATEAATLASRQVLSQASVSMLGQANQLQERALNLLS
jgi:flagellin